MGVEPHAAHSSSRNIVALQVVKRLLLVLPPRAQQIFFVAESRYSCFFMQRSFEKMGVVKEHYVLRNLQNNNVARQVLMKSKDSVNLRRLNPALFVKSATWNANICSNTRAILLLVLLLLLFSDKE